MAVTVVKRYLRRAAISACRRLIRLCSRPYIPGKGRIIVFAPHQDDETIGCGGLIARRRHEGVPVDVIFITDGSFSHPDHPEITAAELISLRRSEASAALDALGVETDAIHYIDERDGTLNRLEPARRAALVKNLSSLIETIRPGEVFVACGRDGSDEHAGAFGCVRDAILVSGLRPVVWQYPVWAWYKPHFLLLNIFNAPTCRLPVEHFQLAKSRARACYRSQFEPLSPWPKSIVPDELRAACEFSEEYFFQFALPARPAPHRLTGTSASAQ